MTIDAAYDETIRFHQTHGRTEAQASYRPFRRGPGVLAKSRVPYLILDLPFAVPYAEMLAEAQAIRALFVPHRDTDRHKGWSSVCIHGLSADMTLKHQAYGVEDAQEAGFHWTEVADMCPVTTAFFKTTFGYRAYHRLRFMLLEPGGWVAPHRDRDVAVDPALRSINLALNHPAACDFVIHGAGAIPFVPGMAVMPDLCRYHSVWNRSSEPRYHIIVNGKRDWDAHWESTVLRSYERQWGVSRSSAS